jgi:hypothetical protein
MTVGLVSKQALPLLVLGHSLDDEALSVAQCDRHASRGDKPGPS